MYKEGIYCHCAYRVNENGDCYTQNGKFEWVHREWRYNSDGYAVVSACGLKPDGTKTFRSLHVHVLVAREFVDGWFEGAEVNHKDFNRANPAWWNLEWLSHKDNIAYSHNAGKYKGRLGEKNPNYGNDTLHKRYIAEPEFAKEKQSRPRGQNGRSVKCLLYCHQNMCFEHWFDCQRDAVDFLIDYNVVKSTCNKESIISKLKQEDGYKGWHLIQDK